MANNERSRVVKDDLKGLHAFVRGIDATGKMRVRLGVLGNKNARPDRKTTGKFSTLLSRRMKTLTPSNMTNADIGAIAELGSFSKGIPARSWLRLPLHQRMSQILAECGPGVRAALEKGDTALALKRLGLSGENAIREGFATSGWGRWAPNAPSTIRRKGSSRPLIDTAQFRQAVASQVVGAGANK